MDYNSTSLSIALDQHESAESFASDTRRISTPNIPFQQNYSKVSDAANKENSYLPEKWGFDDVQKLFYQISNRDESVRCSGLESLYNVILSLVHHDRGLESAKGISWSPPLHRRESVGKETSNHTNTLETAKTVPIIQQVIAFLLRLSVRCPFSDVRSTCKVFLSNLEREDVLIPTFQNEISQFIPNEQIHPVDTDDEETYSLYTESFVHNCRLEHMAMVMGLHPQYLEAFLQTNSFLLHSSGMLSYPYRSYIAIMAAARHKCAYLVHLMEAHFLLQGGDKEWLKGLDYAPPKLQALSTLNKLLAHRPWLITPMHIKELMKSKNGGAWPQSELTQAIVLLCHFHSVAMFCLGTGINLEIDHQLTGDLHFPDSSKSSPTSGKPTRSSTGASTPNASNNSEKPHTNLTVPDNIEVLMERMKKLDEDGEEVSREEKNRHFYQQKQEASNSLLPAGGCAAKSDSYFFRYVVDSEFAYQDFAKRDLAAEIPTFREQDYNWLDHGFLMVSHYSGDCAELLDDKFKIARHLTYKTLAGKEDVDTTPLRRAIWKYVHCMYGILYDDYNYGEVNQLLERPLKMFIKTVSCFPEQTKRQVYDGFWKKFLHSEKVHVAFMIMESRMQIGLLYGMRAMTQCFQRDSS